MKRLVCLLLCMAMLPTLSAMAEAPDDVWVSGYDYQYYYHSVENCRLARNSGALSRQALSDIGDLTPCPVCVEDAAQDADITCFERGGTLVIRMPDAYIRETGDFGILDAGECGVMGGLRKVAVGGAGKLGNDDGGKAHRDNRE